jgi:hypothetical protein
MVYVGEKTVLFVKLRPRGHPREYWTYSSILDGAIDAPAARQSESNRTLPRVYRGSQ